MAVAAVLGYAAFWYAAREWRHWRFRRAIESTDVDENLGAEPSRERDAAPAGRPAPDIGAVRAPVPTPVPSSPGNAARDGLAVAPAPAKQPAESLSQDDRQELERVLRRTNPSQAVDKKKK